jgi:hypothetical protein
MVPAMTADSPVLCTPAEGTTVLTLPYGAVSPTVGEPADAVGETFTGM